MPRLDLSGQRFGRLTVIKLEGVRGCHSLWLCRCDCGNDHIVPLERLRRGRTRSCGCPATETTRKRSTKHGYAGAGKNYRTEYGIWASMLRRCTAPTSKDFKNYGARGITVCERWRKFENFLTDMGNRPPGMTLDRIDKNGNYEPSNCRWATLQEQARNMRSNKMVLYEGTHITLTEAAERSGLRYYTVWGRIQRGWPEGKWFMPTR